MHSNDVFSRMGPERALAFLDELREQAPTAARVALTAAANAFKLRPQFLQRQPRARQAEWVRKALARRMMAAAAEEVLAEYFLEYHNELLGELLDALGVEHEDGQLAGASPACPEKPALEIAVKKFRGGENAERRELLLQAFAAQSAIDWPELEELL